MVVVSISETYDLHTVKDKMTLIGVHTPTKELIQKTYPGLCMNAKFCRIVKTDVVISSVNSTVSVTPDMLGSTADDIAPEDLFNPILYKAVSNDSWSTLEARLNGLNSMNATTPALASLLKGSQAFAESENTTLLGDEFGVYYSLLSNRDGFKMAPIQQGLEMRGLVPLVFEKWYSNGENSPGQDYGSLANQLEDSITDGVRSMGIVSRAPYAMRGRPHPMPRFNTTYLVSLGDSASGGTTTPKQNGMGDGSPIIAQTQMPDLPPLMLAAIIMPPSRRTTLWFRMVCRTWIEFTEVRPIQEIISFAQMNAFAPMVYHSDYNEQSKVMDHKTDMVDTKNAEIQKIMEGA